MVLLEPSDVGSALRECISLLATVPGGPDGVTLEQTHDVSVIFLVGGESVVETGRLAQQRHKPSVRCLKWQMGSKGGYVRGQSCLQ